MTIIFIHSHKHNKKHSFVVDNSIHKTSSSMRNNKTLPVIVGTAIFCVVIILGLFLPSNDETLTFSVRTGSEVLNIEPWYDETQECHYLFLPSYTTLKNVRLNTPNLKLSFGDTVINPGGSLAVLDTGRVYKTTILGRHRKQDISLRIIQSANIPTLFINTAPKNMTKINTNRNAKEYGVMTLMSPTGDSLCLEHKGPIKLKSRGVSSWSFPKKPYLIELERPDSLLGMAPATKWVLIANNYDETNLKTKIVLDYAKTLNYCWTPSSRFVDVYINGSYNGLYLLTEKIEVSPTRLYHNDNKIVLFRGVNKYALREEYYFSNSRESEQYFVLESESPSRIIKYQDELQKLTDAIYGADTISTSQLESILDIHSWSCKYLIDEVFSNYDMWKTSNSFYCYDQTPYIFYGGPAWDYDLGFYYPATHFIGYHISQIVPFYILMKNDEFRKHTIELYRTHSRPYIDWLVSEGIDSLAAVIHSAAHANSIRWMNMFHRDRPQYGWLQPSMPSPDSLKTFLSQHKDFLDRHWLQGMPYQEIYIDMQLSEGDIWTKYRNGQTVSQYIEQAHTHENYQSYVWQDTLSGMTYYPNSVIKDPHAQLILCNDSTDSSLPSAETNNSKRLLSKQTRNKIIRYGSSALLAFFGLSMFGYIIIERRKEDPKRKKK